MRALSAPPSLYRLQNLPQPSAAGRLNQSLADPQNHGQGTFGKKTLAENASDLNGLG